MKNLIIILLLSFSLTVNAQERKKDCIVTKVEYVESYRVKVTKINKCTNVIVIRTYLKKEWDALKKKRKNRKKKN
ncbi:MAG: hypothetical protein HRT87_08075 [Legionellales bacterium]|jgi:hypothetical protein|nr:hypothetical protein [Legionellales bacterium]|tara:strand:- start:1022 stop:1246 length:225 start_codon:yes stop_codon:yes gene_type:complete